MIGNFKNNGAKWDRAPVLVNNHDFLSDASGVGISYGIYDPPRNRGTVCVGISHDTPAFAAHSIATWWKREGLGRYGHIYSNIEYLCRKRCEEVSPLPNVPNKYLVVGH
jgi:hypothetical protein